MKNNIDIEDWYKNELDNYQVKPDEKGWNSISNKLDESDIAPKVTDENIEDWYKNEINNFEKNPDQEIWNKISTNLDLQNVWTRVFRSLNRYDKIIWLRDFTLRSTALLILLFGSYLTYTSFTDKVENSKKYFSDNENQKNEKPIASIQKPTSFIPVSKKNNSTSTKILNTKTSSTQETISKSIQSNYIQKKSNSPKNRITNIHSNATETPLYASLTMDKFSSKKVNGIDLAVEDQTFQTSNLQDINLGIKTLELKEFLVKKEKNKIIFNDKRFSAHFVFGMYAKRIYIGANAGFKKQNLLTRVKSNNQISTAKQHQYLDFGYNFGGTVGIIISDKFNLESNVNFISTSGFNRKYETNDLTFSEDLNLKYTSISVLAKKMNNKSTFDNKTYSTNIIGGLYAGYLTSAEVVSGNNTYNVINEFKTLDLGLVLGIEQDRYLTKQIVITPGIRYTQGLLNISNKDNSYESARTFAFEFNVGMKYIFLKKNK